MLLCDLCKDVIQKDVSKVYVIVAKVETYKRKKGERRIKNIPSSLCESCIPKFNSALECFLKEFKENPTQQSKIQNKMMKELAEIQSKIDSEVEAIHEKYNGKMEAIRKKYNPVIESINKEMDE